MKRIPILILLCIIMQGCFSMNIQGYSRQFEQQLEQQSIDQGYTLIESYAYDDTIYVQILEKNNIRYRKSFICDNNNYVMNVETIAINDYTKQ